MSGKPSVLRRFGWILAALLGLLAIASGVAKVTLQPQDSEFFARYGFNHGMLITFGAVQMLGGALLLIPRTRSAGAWLVAITFVVSLLLLLLDGNMILAAVTAVVTALLVWIALGDAFKPGRSADST